MRRRALLSALATAAAASTAGCGDLLEGFRGQGPDDAPTPHPPTDSPPETHTPESRTRPESDIHPDRNPIASPVAWSADGAIELDLTVASTDWSPFDVAAAPVAPATEERPALVRVAVENTDTEAWSLAGSTTPPFSTYVAREPEVGYQAYPDPDPTGLMLVPAGPNALDVFRDVLPASPRPAGIWQADAVPPEGLVSQEFELEPGGRLAYDFAVVCHPTRRREIDGRFAFANRVEFGDHRDWRGNFGLTLALRGRAGARGLSQFSADGFPGLEEESIPGLPDPNETWWFHESAVTDGPGERVPTRPDPPVLLEPVREYVAGDRGRVGTHLWNFTDEPAETPKRAFAAHKLVDGAWHQVTPDLSPIWLNQEFPAYTPLHRAFAYDNAVRERDPWPFGVLFGIGGGTYALAFGSPSVASRSEVDDSASDEDNQTAACAALVRVDTDQVPVTPTVGASVRERDGATVFVEVTQSDGGGRTVDDVRVELLVGEGGGRRLLSERANQTQAYRNTLGFLDESVDRVVTPVPNDTFFHGLQADGGDAFTVAGTDCLLRPLE